jgi:hypothetical protein
MLRFDPTPGIMLLLTKIVVLHFQYAASLQDITTSVFLQMIAIVISMPMPRMVHKIFLQIICVVYSVHQDPSGCYPFKAFHSGNGFSTALGYTLNMEMPQEAETLICYFLKK